MSARRFPWSLHTLLENCPSVGCLMDLCDENYRHLSRLAPGLSRMRGRWASRTLHGLDLHLEVLEQTPYTTMVHLTYYFPHHEGPLPDPDATLRVYHDSRQVEVVGLRQQALPLNRRPGHPTLEQKWKINLFLAKWLIFCLQQGHHFTAETAESAPAAC